MVTIGTATAAYSQSAATIRSVIMRASSGIKRNVRAVWSPDTIRPPPKMGPPHARLPVPLQDHPRQAGPFAIRLGPPSEKPAARDKEVQRRPRRDRA